MKVRSMLFSAAVCAAVSTISLYARAETWAVPAAAGTNTYDWHTAANWTPATVPNGVGDAADFPTNSVTAAITRVFSLGSTAVTLGSVTFNENDTDAAYNVRANTIGTDAGPFLTFDNGGAGATITLTGRTTTSSANPNAIRGPVILNDNLTITGNMMKAISTGFNPGIFDRSQGVINFLGSGSTMTGAGGVTIDTDGAVFMADVIKEFEGPLVVNKGRLRFNANARVPSLTPSVTVNAGGQLAPEAVGNLTYGSDRPLLSLPIPTITLNGHGLPAQSGVITFPGAMRLGLGGTSQTYDNPVVLASEASIASVGDGTLTGFGKMTFTGGISGPGKLVANPLPGDPVNRRGEVIITAPSSYLGGTRVDQGFLVVQGAGTLGPGNVLVDGQSLFPTFSGSDLYAGVLRLDPGVSNAINDLATLTLTGPQNGNSVNGGTIALPDAGTNEVVGGLVLNGVAQPNGVYNATNAAGFISGIGSITVVNVAVDDADFDNDGDTDGNDFLIWQRGLETGATVSTNATGDANNDADVDGDDLAVWESDFGMATAAAQTIPEPSAALIALLAAPLALLARRKR